MGILIGWRRTEKKEEKNLPEKGYGLRKRKKFGRRKILGQENVKAEVCFR